MLYIKFTKDGCYNLYWRRAFTVCLFLALNCQVISAVAYVEVFVLVERLPHWFN